MNNRILVTGGAGFIGSHVVDRFVDRGCSVIVIDNLSTGKLSNIEEHVNDGLVDFVEADIRNQDAIRKYLGDVNTVVHSAAIVSVQLSMENPRLTYEINVEGTLGLLELCVSSGVNRIVFISSSSVYGSPRYLPIDENHPTCPISPYASSKLEGERCCQKFSDQSGLETVILRLFNVYGPRQIPNEYSGVITKFMEFAEKGEPLTIYGDGSQTRDFVHVTDVAGAILKLIKDDCDGEIFNIGCGKAVSINDLANTIMRVSRRKCELRYEPAKKGDIMHSVADLSKAKKTFGYAAKIGLEEGLQDLLLYRRGKA